MRYYGDKIYSLYLLFGRFSISIFVLYLMSCFQANKMWNASFIKGNGGEGIFVWAAVLPSCATVGNYVYNKNNLSPTRLPLWEHLYLYWTEIAIKHFMNALHLKYNGISRPSSVPLSAQFICKIVNTKTL